MESLCVEGCRNINHSYSLVNQWQLLNLVNGKFKLFHKDIKPFREDWNPKNNFGGFNIEQMKTINKIPTPERNQKFDVIYRINFPLDISEWKETGVKYILNGRTMQMMPMYYQFYKSFIENKQILDIPYQSKKIRQNVIIIHGTDDKVVPYSDAEFLASLITNSTLVLIKNTGHTFDMKHPFEMNHLPENMVKVIDTTINFLSI